jgi:hypothetical protein
LLGVPLGLELGAIDGSPVGPALCATLGDALGRLVGESDGV